MTLQILKARKKPVVVEAVLLTQENIGDIKSWVRKSGVKCFVVGNGRIDWISIQTVDGSVADITLGNYIIRGSTGEFYSCRADVFEQTYDVIEDDDD